MAVDATVVMGVPIHDVTLDDTIALIRRAAERGAATGETYQIATVNVDFLVNAKRDPSVLQLLLNADLCIADGMPVVWSVRLQGSSLRERVAGADLVPALAAASTDGSLRLLLFGSGQGVAERAAELLQRSYPGAVVIGSSGPLIRDPSKPDTDVIDLLRSSNADVICVALGNPKQERWISAHRDLLGIPVLIGVGGTLDFLVGGRQRAPRWLRAAGLEWCWRAAQEPARLGRRYLRDIRHFGPYFAGLLVRRTRRGINRSRKRS